VAGGERLLPAARARILGIAVGVVVGIPLSQPRWVANPKIDAMAQLVELILSVFDGEDIDLLAGSQQNALLMHIVRKNQHLASLQNGVMALAHGARGDGDATQEGRDVQDEDVAAGCSNATSTFRRIHFRGALAPW
jgi:hypothetical protein